MSSFIIGRTNIHNEGRSGRPSVVSNDLVKKTNEKETTWKGKYRSTDNTKYGKGKGKLLPKIEEISGGKVDTNTRKLILNISTITCLSQSEESKCMRTHSKDGITREFLKSATRGLREWNVRGEEGTEGKLNNNYLRLIPGLCLEDRTN